MSGKVVQIKGHARPARGLLERLGRRLGPHKVATVAAILDNEIATDALAALLTRAIETTKTTDGRVDMRTVAQFVLDEMRKA